MKKILTDTSSFLIISITLIAMLVPQPFNDLNRGIIYGIIVAYGAIFCIYNSKKIFLNRSWLFWLGLAFYIETTLAYCINGNLMRVGFAHIQYLFIFLASSTIREEDRLSYEFNKLSKIFTILGIGMAICSYITMNLMIYAPNFVRTLPEELSRMIMNSGKMIDNRLEGFGINANLTANFCALSSLFSLYLIMVEKSRKWHILSIIDIILSLDIIFIKCASRTSMLLILGFPICLFLTILLNGTNRNNNKIIKYIMLIIVIIVIVLLILAFNEPLRNFVLEKIIRINTLKTGSGRLDLFAGSFSITKGHKLWGINKQIFIDKFGFTSPHNSYLELMVHAGVPAMILFIAFYLTSLVKSGIELSKTKRKNSYIRIFLFTYLLAITFHMMLDNYMIASYTTIGMFGHYALGIVIALDENRKTTENP